MGKNVQVAVISYLSKLFRTSWERFVLVIFSLILPGCLMLSEKYPGVQVSWQAHASVFCLAQDSSPPESTLEGTNTAFRQVSGRV